MARDRAHCPLAFEDLDDFSRLRDVLAAAGYTDRGVAEALGIDDARSLSGQDVPLLLRKTSGGTPLETLIRLFLIDVPADVDAARRALAPMTLQQWVDAGLVELEGDSVAAAVQLLPFRGSLLAFDLPRRIRSGRCANYVMGIGSSSLTLANLTVRRHSERTLDLGTGCGLQAFLAAPHSERVVAVDRNPRAVSLAAFNARLNGFENVECLESDLFDSVEGQQFDLVVSNPPFVISPETRYIYRDSGMLGDEVTRSIVRRVPEFLRPGGYCQILCNWAHIAGQDWQERLGGWFEGIGCDAWVMRSDTLESAAYAAKWIRHTERDDPEEFARRFDQWTEYYGQQRIEAISGGLITIRRRPDAVNWFRADDAPEKMLGPVGDGVQQGFELHDFVLATRDDRSLLDHRLRISPDVRLEQRLEPSADGWTMIEARLELARGLAYSGNVDPYMANLLTRCDGKRPLRDLLSELAASLDEDADKISAGFLEVVRRLIQRGFLLPPDDES